MKRTIRLTESELTKMITECVKSSIRSNKKKALKYPAGNSSEEKVYKKLEENVEYDDYASISEALVQCGWAYTDSFEVVNRKTGQYGMRYIIEPYPNNPDGIKPMNVEEMKAKMTEFIGPDNVLFSEGQHRQAPEIKNLSMVVFE